MLEHPVVEVAELGVAIRVLGTLELLGGRLQAVAGLVQQPPHRQSLAAWPCPASVADSCRVDLIVQRSGDSGSPRVSGSTRRSNAAPSAGFTVSARLRPAPARRIRPESVAPLSSSSTPRVTVERAAPVARATNVIPPCPASRASTAIHSRRCRSSSTGASNANLRDTSLSRSAAVTTSHRIRPESRT